MNQTNNKRRSRITNSIPHHAVTNVNKLNKVRIAFDAGAKTRGNTLNEHLLKGPDFLSNIVGVLLKFYERQFPIISDITQMFNQVQVFPTARETLRL